MDDTVSQCHHQFCVRQTSEHRPDLFGVGKSEVCAGLDEILQLPHRGDVRKRRWARLPRSGLSEVSVRWDEALGRRKYAVLVAELPVEVWNAGDDLDEVATLSRPAVYDIQQSPNESAVSVAWVCDYELRLAGRDGHLTQVEPHRQQSDGRNHPVPVQHHGEVARGERLHIERASQLCRGTLFVALGVELDNGRKVLFARSADDQAVEAHGRCTLSRS